MKLLSILLTLTEVKLFKSEWSWVTCLLKYITYRTFWDWILLESYTFIHFSGIFVFFLLFLQACLFFAAYSISVLLIFRCILILIIASRSCENFHSTHFCAVPTGKGVLNCRHAHRHITSVHTHTHTRTPLSLGGSFVETNKKTEMSISLHDTFTVLLLIIIVSWYVELCGTFWLFIFL